ncbi:MULTISPECIES: FmdB family zinc ribbon protein [Rhodococcus]|uniref:FmdB family transcriptional regulator n=1 Tax=Rhodococcus oxybenzonivorans TaxID=1990687 RepID=A0A2S2BZH2_9NOCA|nr:MULTISPECIES: FmdB family zinc ribbon protein [Rhodococcus]AWK74020.1 FmdB family transcriptional regulator [Rhodococcus oxybenzonivorans]MDV7243930.1 FmdB family zinc ribbon protein [Rhodococcus oxybenzonivorans]MDV7263811.1 FmdB family zinc ribbon protein [Rhodococcus oxybenzonivorans]MDV7274828.1 FmdB family zinc ribbon protein [Rhodococcus oxybenzonivorans]MDV7335067.1 FmdB family zinc ribbon protein [Rhodococcus oxybenzonivorans]
MPTYSYACTECDNRFDIVQSFSDNSLTVCPACSGKLRKLFNSVGIVFKGSGFYRTDSRGSSGAASEPAKTESAPAAKAESSSTASSSSTSTATAAPAKAAAS